MIHDQRLFRSEAFGSSRGVHRGIAAAVHHHAPAEARAFAAAHAVQKRHGIDDAGRVACRNIDTARHIGPNCSEDRIETPRIFFGDEIVDFVIEHDLDAQLLDSAHFTHEFLTRQPIGRNTEMHHPAG